MNVHGIPSRLGHVPKSCSPHFAFGSRKPLLEWFVHSNQQEVV